MYTKAVVTQYTYLYIDTVTVVISWTTRGPYPARATHARTHEQRTDTHKHTHTSTRVPPFATKMQFGSIGFLRARSRSNCVKKYLKSNLAAENQLVLVRKRAKAARRLFLVLRDYRRKVADRFHRSF